MTEDDRVQCCKCNRWHPRSAFSPSRLVGKNGQTCKPCERLRDTHRRALSRAAAIVAREALRGT